MESVAVICSLLMIAKPSIAFNEFTGTAKDVTARSIQGRTILSHKAYQDNVTTPAQAASRNTLSKISRAYRQLTDSQMAAWETLAGKLRGRKVFGVSGAMTGHNAFVRLNSNLSIIHTSLMLNAPAEYKSLPDVTFQKLYLSDEEICFEGINYSNFSHYLVVKMTAAVSTGVSNAWSKTVVVVPGTMPFGGRADITYAFQQRMGIPIENEKKYFFEMYWIDVATGFTGNILRFSCIADLEHDRNFKPDAVPGIIDIELYSKNGSYHLIDFKMIAAGESSAVTIEGTLNTEQFSDSVSLRTGMRPEAFPSIKCYCLSVSDFYYRGAIDAICVETMVKGGRHTMELTVYNKAFETSRNLFDTSIAIQNQ